jgi:phytoene synthase
MGDGVLPEDLAACRHLMRAGSKSFSFAARLLPRRVREPATVLYAFCRVADDRVDEDPRATVGAVHALRRRLERAYAGTPEDAPVDRALAAVVAQQSIPVELPLALLDGLAWDAEGRRYETLEDVQAYGARVAGSVGAMMTLLMGPRSAAVLARACDLGVAMQLTNIARDVGEDARRGRLYLPLSWMREASIEPDSWLSEPRFDERAATVIARVLEAADDLYGRADLGVPLLPADCRLAIRAARLIYADIGRAVARRRFDSISGRARVSGLRKLWLLVRALRAPARAIPAAAAPPLPSTRFLVDACAAGADA